MTPRLVSVLQLEEDVEYVNNLYDDTKIIPTRKSLTGKELPADFYLIE